MKSNKYLLILFVLVSLSINACKKDQATPPPTINFSIAISGDTVRFTNLTTGASSYLWDFGDGDSSTDESPMHVYPGKGKYVPTLYATTQGGVQAQGSTVINIAKTSPIRLDDNTLSDWDTISANVFNCITNGSNNIIIQAKFDYDANNVYFYMEENNGATTDMIYDIYIDDDNNPATGYLCWMWSGGYDELLEGQLLLNQTSPDTWDPVWVGLFNGASQSDFSFQASSISNFFQIGTIEQDGDTLKFEGSLDRSKLKLTGQAIRIGFNPSEAWGAPYGYLPDAGTSGYLLNLPN